MVIEMQTISYILSSPNGKTFIEKTQLSTEWFHIYDDEIKYIINHYNKYKKLPDVLTFLQHFEDFEIEAVTETESYLLSELLNNHRYVLMSEEMQRIAPLVATDPETAQKELDKLAIELKGIDFYKFEGVDLFSEEFTQKAKKEFMKRKELEGLSGISTGINELDKLVYGWQDEEELVVILGRINEGKSWILLYFLVEAFKKGHNVLMYSGEMSKTALFARIVTFMQHIGNRQIMTGDSSVEDSYLKFIEMTKEYENKFIVIEPQDLGGKKLTTDTLEQYIKKYQPNIVGIDQLSLMEDYRRRKGTTTREAYNHITQDLFLMSTEYKVPMLLNVQANRGSVQDKKASQFPPELHQIAEADAIGQNATKVLSIKNKTGIEMDIDLPNLLLKICKNRFGEKDVMLGFKWEINLGKIERQTLVNTSNQDDEEVDDIF